MYRYLHKLISGAVRTGFCMAVTGMVAHAQLQHDYTPRKTYDENSRELISAVRDQLREELDRIESKKKIYIAQIYMERTNYLIRGIRRKSFIQDDTLQQFTDSVLKRILENNTIHHEPKKILILKSPALNASCFGEGTFTITAGLLSRIRNEGQLAFAIAHELAHYELDHIRKRITLEAETRVSKTANRELTKVFTDDVTLEDLDSLRKLVYGIGKFSRQMEREADSLGFIYFRNAGYDQPQAIAMLNILDSAESARRPGIDLFKPFYFSKFPFQDYWLKQRASIFSKKSTNTFIFSNDSLSTHPEIALRKAVLSRVITGTGHPLHYLPKEFVSDCIALALFESVESAYANKLYDRCLFLALELLDQYPRNTYLITTISKVLIDIHDAKDNGTFQYVVPAYTSYYSEELRKVNNFLHNLTREETGEIAFHFLNNQSNFNPAKEEHYFLLWKICTITQRREVMDRIRQAYRGKFVKGEYYDRMK